MTDLSVTKAYLPSIHGQLHYRIASPPQPTGRPPLLCLHQTPGSGRDWEPVLADLALQRVVVAPDTPGYGMSDPPPAPLAIEDFAAIMTRFMADLNAAGLVEGNVFDVMGAHTGSLTATELARANPLNVRRLILFGLAAYEADVRAAKLATLRDRFPAPANDLTHVEKLWAIFGKLSDPRMGPEEKHVAMAECLRLGSRMPWAYIAVYRYDFLQALTEVTQEALVINPQDDLWDVTRQVSDRLPHGRRWDLPGVSHGVLSLETDRVVGEIQAFLNA